MGPVVVYTATMASAGTLTGEINLSTQAWTTVYLEVPTLTSNTQLHLKAANSTGGTFRRVKHPAVNTSSVQCNDYSIASAATGVLVPLPAGLRFIKIESTATVDDGCVFRVICSTP